VADNDKYLRSLIDNGSATANQLRTFLQQNRVNLGQLINNLVTTNEVVVKYLPGIRQVLVVYPYVVAGGFTVAKKNRAGRYDAQFGFILTDQPKVCEAGYVPRRSPQDRSDRPMRTDAGCKDGSKNLRGAEKAPQGNSAGANRPPVATYDERTGKVTWSDQDPSANIAYDGGAAQFFGADSWKTMLLQPSLADDQE